MRRLKIGGFDSRLLGKHAMKEFIPHLDQLAGGNGKVLELAQAAEAVGEPASGLGDRDSHAVVRPVLHQELVAEGVRCGEFRPVDPKIAVFAILGAINWIARWYRPEGAVESGPLGEGFAAILLEGLVE